MSATRVTAHGAWVCCVLPPTRSSISNGITTAAHDRKPSLFKETTNKRLRKRILWKLRFVLAGVFSFCIVATIALVVTYLQRDQRECNKGKGRTRVAACSRLLKMDWDDIRYRALIYGNRGDAYHDLKDYHRAVQDYTQAIRLDGAILAQLGIKQLKRPMFEDLAYEIRTLHDPRKIRDRRCRKFALYRQGSRRNALSTFGAYLALPGTAVLPTACRY